MNNQSYNEYPKTYWLYWGLAYFVLGIIYYFLNLKEFYWIIIITMSTLALIACIIYGVFHKVSFFKNPSLTGLFAYIPTLIIIAIILLGIIHGVIQVISGNNIKWILKILKTLRIVNNITPLWGVLNLEYLFYKLHKNKINECKGCWSRVSKLMEITLGLGYFITILLYMFNV